MAEPEAMVEQREEQHTSEEPQLPAEEQLEERSTPKAPRNASLSLDALCITIAKATVAARPKTPRPRSERKVEVVADDLLPGAKTQADQVFDVYCNGIVHSSAAGGALAKAEHWTRNLHVQRGCRLSGDAFEALLRAAVREGDFQKAEDWFYRAQTRNLDPELRYHDPVGLVGLKPGRVSYDIMIQGAAAAKDLVRGRRYFDHMQLRGFRPSLTSWHALIRACLEAGEAREAHRYLLALLEGGCSSRKSADYQPAALRLLLRKPKALRWNVEEHLALVGQVARALADAENPITADGWLRYLADSGSGPGGKAQSTWEHVRAAYPKEIVPAVFSCFSDDPNGWGKPSRVQPATLSGEQALVVAKKTWTRPCSQASTRTPRSWTPSSAPQAFYSRPNSRLDRTPSRAVSCV